MTLCIALACAACLTSCDYVRGRSTISGRLIQSDDEPASGVGVSVVPCEMARKIRETDGARVEYLWDSRKLARGVPDVVSDKDGRFSVHYSPRQVVAVLFAIPGGESRYETGGGAPMMMPSGMALYPPIRLRSRQALDLGNLRIIEHSVLGYIVIPAEGLGVNASYDHEAQVVFVDTEN